MRWLRYHRQAFLLALRRWLGSPYAALFATLAMAAALALPGSLYLGYANLAQLGGQLPAQPQITLYLKTGLDGPTLARLRRRLVHDADLASARFVSKADALAQLQAAGLADPLTGLSGNPLPDAWVLTPKDPRPGTLARLSREYAAWPGVDRVSSDSLWARRLAAALAVVQTVTVFIAALFAIALAAIAANSVRSATLARREEIQVSRLIGASDAYLRLPYLYQGLLQGLAAGGTTLLILALLMNLLDGPVGTLSALYGSRYALLFLSPAQQAFLVCFPALFSWLGAWFSVTRTLHRVDRSSS